MTLEEKYLVFLRGQGFVGADDDIRNVNFVTPARVAFIAGAAAMAEIVAENPIRIVMTGNPGSAGGGGGGAGQPAIFGSGG